MSDSEATSSAALGAMPSSLKVMDTTEVPSVAFNCAGVPPAMTLPWSTTTISLQSRSASSRYWVVSRTVVPSATSPSMTPHRS